MNLANLSMREGTLRDGQSLSFDVDFARVSRSTSALFSTRIPTSLDPTKRSWPSSRWNWQSRPSETSRRRPPREFSHFPHLKDRIERLLTLHSVMNGEMTTLWEGSSVNSSAEPAGSGGSQLERPELGGKRVGAYQILEEVGRGGMGVVYKARQTNLSRIVALKMILAGEYAGLKDRARLRIEAEAAALLHHPNVVQIFEIGEHQGLPFLALEYVPGGTLAQIARGKPQSFRWSARIVETLARAILLAHQKGVIHRDLNPSNILIASDGTPKISDFGLAKFLQGDLGLSQSGTMQGTPSYMAPEQIDGRGGGVGPATDIYALGALLYELLTGVAPFRGLTPMETLCQVVEADVVPPSRFRLELPSELDTICLKCLEREPANRYASAQELADDLRWYQENKPILARPLSRFKRASKWIRRQPMVAALIALIVVLGSSLVGVIGWYNVYLRQTNQQLERLVGLERKQAVDALNQGVRASVDATMLERHWYDARINLAHRSQEADDPEMARELLDGLKSRTTSRAGTRFEWLHLDQLIRIRSAALRTSEAADRPGCCSRLRACDIDRPGRVSSVLEPRKSDCSDRYRVPCRSRRPDCCLAGRTDGRLDIAIGLSRWRRGDRTHDLECQGRSCCEEVPTRPARHPEPRILGGWRNAGRWRLGDEQSLGGLAALAEGRRRLAGIEASSHL